ncbi:flagellar motor switch protein FliM [Bacillus horti]|uniref:Flagellar motor switch protein FliM n=1 Tax=Caldalkalibacillus horti TaxID=77523 RepID=A0ABT9VV19_9BACI|nr:flagellar motor switch protein FliM [Bacillus horti]MDQ0164672.1 flagellar motor switch protein FliM [Bacillus horti]
MPEVLSQGEIDALLSALSTGEMDAEELKKEETEKKVKVYDFKRALRFSKDQIRSITRIYENYARLLTTYFSAQLRTFVQITVASVDQLPYDEFIRSIPKMTILNVFNADPLEGRMVMEVNPNIAFAMLDRMLGGQGNGLNNISSLTEIETTVMERMFIRALQSFEEAWKSVLDLNVELDVLEINPQFMQIVSPNETVAVVSLSTKIGESTGMINFCMPHVTLEPIIPKLSAHYWLSTQKKIREPQEKEELEKRVRKTKLPVIAELGHSTINVQEFTQLTKGDVIRLNESIGDQLCIKVGHKPKFLAQPGTYKGRVAVQVTEKISEEEE